MSMHLAFVFIEGEQDLYAGPTIGLDGGRFHCNPSRQSAQPFSILDNICQSTANPGPTYQCNANLLNNANANATQSYQSIINLPTNALIHSTSQIHLSWTILPIHQRNVNPKHTSPSSSDNQAIQSKPNRLRKLGLIMDWHQLAVHRQISCQSMMNSSHKARFTQEN